MKEIKFPKITLADYKKVLKLAIFYNKYAYNLITENEMLKAELKALKKQNVSVKELEDKILKLQIDKPELNSADQSLIEQINSFKKYA